MSWPCCHRPLRPLCRPPRLRCQSQRSGYSKETRFWGAQLALTKGHNDLSGGRTKSSQEGAKSPPTRSTKSSQEGAQSPPRWRHKVFQDGALSSPRRGTKSFRRGHKVLSGGVQFTITRGITPSLTIKDTTNAKSQAPDERTPKLQLAE